MVQKSPEQPPPAGPRSAQSRPTWPLVILGIIVVAVIGLAFSLLNNDDPDSAIDPGTEESPPSESPSSQVSESPKAGEDEESPTASPLIVPVYYVGETPRGLGLYLELVAADSADVLNTAVDLAVSRTPVDPDYRTPWPSGTQATASYDGDVITIDLIGDASLHDSAPGIAADQAQMALEQLIFTAQEAVGEARPGVQFLLNGNRTDQVLGQPTSEPLANEPVLETLSQVNLTAPTEGYTASGQLSLAGRANSFEANVIISLEGTGGTVLEEGVSADGWMGEELFAFEHVIDVGDLEPGTYVLTAMTDDPSGGEEGFGAFSDTKTITIE